MKKLKILLKYAIPYKWYALLNIIFNVFGAMFSLVSLASLIPVLNILFKQSEPVTTLVPWSLDTKVVFNNLSYYISQEITRNGATHTLMIICIGIVVLFFFKNFFRYLALFYVAVLRNGVVKDLRNALYHKILILPLAYYSDQRKGDIMSRITNDVQEVEWSILSSLEMLFRDPITIVIYLVAMFKISPELTMFVLIVLPVAGYLIGLIGRSLRRTSQKGQRKMGELLSLIEETISGLRIIKGFNAINYSYRNFDENNRGFMRLMVRLFRKRDLASPISEFLGIAVTALILWYGGKLILSSEASLTAPKFILYIGIFSQIIVPAKAITTAFYNIEKGSASIDRINQVLEAGEVIVEKPDALEIREFKKSVEYRNVLFKYEKDYVLNDVSITIPKGKMIALVGPSGGGKSTLVDLLPRFYDVTEGGIYIDGNDLRDLKIDHLRGLMGIVSQETILFNGTVAENIAFGMNESRIEDIIHAAKVANAHEFIEKLENGYETNIGDRGVKLSGGQRQRISIARAVLKNPPILILDEATSALDTESERLVQEALLNLMKNRTSIVIAHRLSTIQHADEIIVINEGKIAEQGSHNELLAAKGIYSHLCEMQSFS
ncbi:MAG TPA: ABC transporter ATP-binding protein [Bacteroidales bacterium]|nr:ABC transporter ATP-binding protein [Bacteroidales bacterium]